MHKDEQVNENHARDGQDFVFPSCLICYFA
jgi:hypothetical protein